MIKLKQRLKIYVSVLLLILTGCTHDSFFSNRPGAEDDFLTFTYRVDGMTTNSATRAAVSPIEGETSIQSLHLLFFHASGDQSGTLVGTVSLQDGAGELGKLTMETSYVLPSDGAEINPSRAYRIIGIGNLDEFVEDANLWLAQWDGVTEAFFRENAMVETAGTDNEGDYETYNPIKINALLMNGFVDKPANTKNIQMVLTRNVARFDVQNNATTHKLQTVSIWNAYTQSSITSDARLNYSMDARHTKRFYGIDCPETPGNIITGGLYAFANYSDTPAINDKNTTCLIVGLAPTDGSARRYYRVNVNSIASAQHLKNNFAYNITVLSVSGEGYPTEKEAWEGTKNQLVYNVNNWNLDDNGLIVSDENSILVVPVKTVKINSQGGEFSYSVTTFSTLESPAPLRIKSQLFDPADGNITARISNGNLVIEASAMNTGEEKRSGIITITYAGLEATVNILQTASGDAFLEVTLNSGWKEFLPPTANTMSEYINVKASGSWTAQLHGSTHFAFQNSLGDYVRQVSSREFTNNKFLIYTTIPNESKTETEKGFVLITLDSDPTNYIAVVTVNQASKGGIETSPENLETIQFFGSGNLETTEGNLETIVPSSRFKFKVSSAGSISENNVKLAGENYNKFDFTYDVATGYITVWAKGMNFTKDPYTATIVVSDNKNGNLLVNIVEKPLILNLTPPAEYVKAIGGQSGQIVVDIEDPDAKWTAEITTVATGERAIFNHKAKLRKANGELLGAGEVTDQNLIVEFPKIYYPNRETGIKAVVTLTTNNGVTGTCEVYQDKLAANNLKIWSRWSDGTVFTYGSLGNKTYFDGFINRLNTKIPSGLSSVLTMGTNSNRGVFPTNEHVWLQTSNSNTSDTPCWTEVNEWYNNENNDGVVVYMMGEANNHFSYASVYSKGYTHGGTGRSSGSVRLNAGVNNTRIYDFIINRGNSTISTPTQLTFYNDVINSYLSAYPEGAVPILNYASGGFCLVVDPINRAVFMGDETMFRELYLNDTAGGYLNYNDRSAFIYNLIDYLLNAAKYGSHFTDMLIDGASVAEPWSTVWGNNAWPN